MNCRGDRIQNESCIRNSLLFSGFKRQLGKDILYDDAQGSPIMTSLIWKICDIFLLLKV